MRKIFYLLMSMFMLACGSKKRSGFNYNKSAMGNNIAEEKITNMNGEAVSLSSYTGKVLLIVNVASKCGYTPQYEGLQALYEKYKGKGFEILAIPSNDFGGQEPGTNDEIRTFCESKYNVTFPIFNKVSVLDGGNSLYSKLSKFAPAGPVDWNFEKFLISKTGEVVGRFKSGIEPTDEKLTNAIEEQINER